MLEVRSFSGAGEDRLACVMVFICWRRGSKGECIREEHRTRKTALIGRKDQGELLKRSRLFITSLYVLLSGSSDQEQELSSRGCARTPN